MKDHVFIKKFFTEDQLAKFDSLEKELFFEGGATEQKAFASYRKVNSCYIPLSEEEWLENHLNKKIKEIKEVFGDSLDVSGGIESCEEFGKYISFLKYGKGHHYKWHLDNSHPNDGLNTRTLSLTIQLSGPEEYEEGEVLLKIDNKDIAIDKEKNSACAFLSTKVLHKVCPIKTGTRRSLVVWVHGKETIKSPIRKRIVNKFKLDQANRDK